MRMRKKRTKSKPNPPIPSHQLSHCHIGNAAKQEIFMPKCKPGDLAIIIHAHNPQNLGTIVRIIDLHPDQLSMACPKGDTIWRASGPRPMLYDINGIIKRRRIGPVPDSQLQPIRGGKSSKSTVRRKVKSLETA